MADSLPDIVIPERQIVGLRQQYALQHPTLNRNLYDNSSSDSLTLGLQNKIIGCDVVCFTNAVQPSMPMPGLIVPYKSVFYIYPGDNETWIYSPFQGRCNLGAIL